MSVLAQQQITINNSFMRLFARKDDALLCITHAGMYAQTTDALLAALDGEIAFTINDGKYTVIASMIAPKVSANVLWEADKVSDLSTDDKPLLPLYVEADGKLFQVAQVITTNPDDETDAIHAGNLFMASRPDTGIICSTDQTEEKEVKILHFIASLVPST